MDKLLGSFHILLILIFCYLGFLGYQDFEIEMDSQKMDSQGLVTELERYRQKLGEIAGYKKNLARSRQKLKEVREQIVLIQEKLPSEKDQTGLLNFLSEQADNMRLVDTSFSPLPEIDKELYFVEKYEIQGMGTFQQFLVYLEKMSQQTRVYNIDFIEMRPVSEVKKAEASSRSRKFQMLESKIIIETYRFNKAFFEATMAEIKSQSSVETQPVNQENQ